MRADQDVHFARRDLLQYLLLLLRRAEARDHLDVDRKVGEAALEALVVLECEDRGRSEHGDLLAILHRLERRAHGDLGLAVAHVAAEQAVHGLGRFHIALDVGDGGDLIVGLVEVEGILKLALHVGVGREGGADRGAALRVELQQLAGHVGHGLLHPRLGLLPGLSAELVELGRGAGVGRPIFLDEVETGERNIELGLIRELQDHQFERRLVVLFNDSQSAVARDAVLDVDDVVADGEVAEVGDEGGRFGLGAGDRAGLHVGVVDKVVGAKEDELACGGATVRVAQIEHLDAIRDGSANDDGSAQVSGEIAGLGVDVGAARGLGARAETVGDVILLQQAGEALDLALVGRGDQNAGILLGERVDGLDERGNAAVEALGGPGGEVDLGEIAAVGVENVDSAKLVEFEAGELAQAVVEVPGRDVDILRADERADAGAVVALLDLVPPALALVLDHGRLLDENACGGAEEIEQGGVGACDGREELPAGKDGGFHAVGVRESGFGEEAASSAGTSPPSSSAPAKPRA